MNSQMEGFPHDDELSMYFGNSTPAALNAGYGDWTTTSGFNDGAWIHATDEVPLHAGTDLADTTQPPTTDGELLHQQSDFLPCPFVDPSISSIPSDDISLNSADFAMMDSFWPVLPDPGFLTLEFWDPSLETVQPHFEPLPPAPASSLSIPSTSPEEEIRENGRKKRRRIPPAAKTLLEDCFEEHKADPYIPQHKMKELASQTGLSLRQVRTFFANARARKLPPVPGSPKLKKKSANKDIPGSTNVQQDPMQRFLSSSPEEEGISEEAVRNAANRISQTSSFAILRSESGDTDAISVSDTTFSSNSGSGSSQASIDSTNSRGPRRGRKRQREPTQNAVEEVVRKPSDPNKKYQCTFCPSDFAQKFDWRRHEESVHFPQKQWICMPDGPTYNATDGLHCVFCDEHNPDDEHLETHNSNTCPTLSLSSRTFLRKDKLVQHLTQVHRCCQFPKRIQDWCLPIKRSVTPVCGLCGLILPDWATRVEHISSHFHNGIGMDKWILDHLGGVMAHSPTGSDESIQLMCNPVVDPDGDFQCEVCPDRFSRLSHVIFHYRQTHDIYSSQDRVFMHVITWPSNIPAMASRKELTDMAQASFGMKLFQKGNHGRAKRISQIKRPMIPLVKKTGVQGNGEADQENSGPIAPSASTPTFIDNSSASGPSTQSPIPDSDTQGNEMLNMRLKCKLKPLYNQQVENVAYSRNKLSNNSMMPQGGALLRPTEHIPAALISQVDPQNRVDSPRLVPHYLGKALSKHYSARKPRVASLLSQQHFEAMHPPAKNMNDNPMPPQNLFQPTSQFPGTSTSTPQDPPWPDALHETHHLSVPTDHSTAIPPRPKRMTRLSSTSMRPPQPVSENEIWVPGNFSQQDSRSVVVDTDSRALHMDSVANAIAESLANWSFLGNSAQYQCWNGQTRKSGGGGGQSED